MSDLLNEEDQAKANEIEVHDVLLPMCQVNKACYPEELFEMIEQCRLCGRCV